MKTAPPVQALRFLGPGLHAFRMRLAPARDWHGNPRQHDQVGVSTITLVLEGALPVERRRNGVRFLRPGDGMFCPPTPLLRPRMDLTGRPVDLLQIAFSPARFLNVPGAAPAGPGPSFFRFSLGKRAALAAQGFGNRKPLSDAEMERVLIDWWREEPSLAGFTPQLAALRLSSRQGMLMEDLHRGELSDFRVETLAERFAQDRFAFYKRFIREWGFSPMLYVQMVRLGRALEELSCSRFPSSRLPAQAGFPDASRFFKLFHQMVGMSPARFRRESGF